ncbi:hypothetical protein D3C75_1355540 [compost metagenome]
MFQANRKGMALLIVTPGLFRIQVDALEIYRRIQVFVLLLKVDLVTDLDKQVRRVLLPVYVLRAQAAPPLIASFP